MTFQFNLNSTPTNGHVAIFNFKQFMVGTAGWTIPQSSDGLTASSSDVITGSGSGAGGISNIRSWFRLQQPSSTREFCFQNLNASNGTTWRVKYSPIGFTNGGTATNTPTANVSSFTGVEDAGVILGSALGTDSSPSGSALLPTDDTYHFHMMGDDAAPNGFYFFCTTVATTSIPAGFMFDPLTTNTFPAGDTDPYTIFQTTSTFGTGNNYINFGSAPFCFLKRGMTGEAFIRMGGSEFAVNNPASGFQTIIGQLPSNPTNNTDDLLPVVMARPQFWSTSAQGTLGQPCGYKGVSSLLKWITSARSNLDMLTVTNPGDRIVCNNITVPWNNTNPIL